MAPNAPSAGHVLVVDDDPLLRRFLACFLESLGYQVTTAANGSTALARVAARPPDLILLDLDLPDLSGMEVCQRVKADPATRLIPVLILTGRDPDEARQPAWDAGADEYLTKPIRSAELATRCRSLIRLKAVLDELDSAHATLFAFTRAVEAKCPYTLGHTERVTAYALRLAAHVGLVDGDREALRRGSILHDIGKISTPDAILNKPGRLTPAEYEVIKRHPLEGVRIVEPLRSLRSALPLIRWHHERLDGRGYPDGLFGGAIPLLARILAVADVYDALASDRPYRPALPHDACIEELRANAAGGGLDPDLVRGFIDLVAVGQIEPPGPGPRAAALPCAQTRV
jgi:putative two-component system response regulator